MLGLCHYEKYGVGFKASRHPCGRKALRVDDEMKESGLKPNDMTSFGGL